ncbi:hypothetical protein SLEP1_g18862 [Rubroshorea leprosula]|uniref:Uncharacterized protein n=1 Tax=Rubroshorea leprosula TaxID=152421 RepID=A0AAV5J4G8_9ROSI|nr:hypothetical protein SLEP1_g18862 [Rubroshorea leprosula]
MGLNLFYASTVPNGFKAIYSEASLRYSLHMLDLMPLLIQLKNQGSLRGAAAVFFAYVGFDAVANSAEESRKPQESWEACLYVMDYTLEFAW